MSKPAPLYSPAGVLGSLGCAFVAAFAPLAAAQTPADSPANVESGVSPDSLSPNDTEILANQGATFAAKDRVAVFNGDVRVRDPRFTLACDKLTVYLAKGAIPDAGNSSPAAPPAATPPPIKSVDSAATKDANRGGGIDRAVAEGHVIIVQKRAATKPGEEEKLSVGRAETVEFDNKTGDLTLRGLPKVEQNGDYHEALTRATYMILHRDNSLDTIGPSKTHIVQRNKDSDGASGKPSGKPVPNASPGNRRPSGNATQD